MAAISARKLLQACLAALCTTFVASVTASAAPAITVRDDAGQTISLTAPAQRIVSLAPHATELLFAAGAGAHVVGVSQYSDFPEQAKQLASVGGSASLDLERIIALKPDLIVAWASGNSAPQVAKLRSLGFTIFESEPHNFTDIASSLERLAQLAGTYAAGRSAADAFRTRVQHLASQYQQRSSVDVFYEIWRDPLMTLNDTHLVSAAIGLCGGRNIFGKQPQLTVTVDTEAVLKADPEVIVAGGGTDDDLKPWRAFPQMRAVKRGNLFTLNADTMTRGTPRLLEGTAALCEKLELARARRER